ncbi:MAG: hypothetical protein OXC06_17155 [Acidimicrobiaceae bacterium]|nr:hypothetical protein [Acidimicrobiaceae bacterium]
MTSRDHRSLSAVGAGKVDILDPATVESSGPRIIENFLDLAHFPFVREGFLGQEPYTEVARYGVEASDDELRLTDCV